MIMTNFPLSQNLLKNQILANSFMEIKSYLIHKPCITVTGPSQHLTVHMEKVNIIVLYQCLCKHVDNSFHALNNNLNN